MPPKSIFRGPNAQHFQLVHRSQQDPLINDPEASQRVFKPVNRANDGGKKTGYTLAELDASMDKAAMRQNEGEAALYGITYDDSAYDYMAHLKPVGQGGVIESVLIAGPKGSTVAKGMKTTAKGKGKAKDDEMFDLLPKEVLPSKDLMSVREAQAREAAIPEELLGLQPDMDPHLRQVLEALEDDAFVDEAEEDDWFGELVKGGERDEEEEEVPWDFAEWGVDDQGAMAGGPAGPSGPGGVAGIDREETWEDRFKAFKQQQARVPEAVSSDIDPEELAEMDDEVGSLNPRLADLKVKGGKRPTSDASGMSMSSSSMFRNTGLRDLDDRFDKIEQDYENDDDEEYEEYEEDDFPDDDTASIAASNFSVASRFSLASHASRAAAGPPAVSREDFDSIMDDFLENYEVVGRKFRPALGGTGLTGAEKLQVLRRAIDGEGEGEKEENRRRIMEVERMEGLSAAGGRQRREKKERVAEADEEKWDVQTILSTYTNTENHPGMIRTRTAAQAKARAEAKAKAQAQAEAEAEAEAAQNDASSQREEGDETDSGSETEREGGPRVTVSRPKGELAEEKRARKASVKAERSARRAEKKSHKETFSIERKKQLASHQKMVGGGKAADMLVGTRGVVSLS